MSYVQILMSVTLMMTEGVSMFVPTLMEAITVLVIMDINSLMTLSIALVCNYFILILMLHSRMQEKFYIVCT